jgi:hypothetical protein
MKILDPGHDYLLSPLDGDIDIRLTFVKREGVGYPGNIGSYSGTTCQEVLRSLIDRLDYINNQIPCFESKISRFCLFIALWMFELRHSRRKKLKLVMPWDMNKPINPKNGHIIK